MHVGGMTLRLASIQPHRVSRCAIETIAFAPTMAECHRKGSIEPSERGALESDASLQPIRSSSKLRHFHVSAWHGECTHLFDLCICIALEKEETGMTQSDERWDERNATHEGDRAKDDEIARLRLVFDDIEDGIEVEPGARARSIAPMVWGAALLGAGVTAALLARGRRRRRSAPLLTISFEAPRQGRGMLVTAVGALARFAFQQLLTTQVRALEERALQALAARGEEEATGQPAADSRHAPAPPRGGGSPTT